MVNTPRFAFNMPHSFEQRRQHIRPVGYPTVGGQVNFISGQFAGHTYRAELEELQKADLGRKYARKDRRPIDPPPIVLFKFIEILHADQSGAGMSERVVEDYNDFEDFGFLCHVDLFPVPAEDESDISRFERKSGSPTRPASSSSVAYSPVSSSSLASTSGQYSSDFSAGWPPMSYSISPSQLPSSLSRIAYTPAHSPTTPRSFPLSTWPHSLPPLYSIPALAPPAPLQVPAPSSVAPSDVVAYAGDFAITESSKCTEAVCGATFVQACTLKYEGKQKIMLVFSDLAVKIEGTFCLRYRIFNIFSKAVGDAAVPILAECYGGPFKIYPSKEFPGLRPSTDLTKHISLFGVRLNLRKDEHKRQKTSHIEGERTSQPAVTARPPSAIDPTVSNSAADTAAFWQRRGGGNSMSMRLSSRLFSSEESDHGYGYTHTH